MFGVRAIVMNQRIILILVIVVSASITLLFNNVYADKGSGWFDSRNFWNKVNNMDMFENYPYDSPMVKVHVIVDDYVDSKVIPDILVQYDKEEKKIKSKQFKKDNAGEIEFKVDDGAKKVCIMAIGYDWKDCKKFKSYDEENEVFFYLGR